MISILGCTSKDMDIPSTSYSFNSDPIIEINTSRNFANRLNSEVQTRSSDNPFIDTKEVESTESVVIPALEPHIWIGNILMKSSIANCDYKPLVYPRSPINVTLTLVGTESKTITSPTFSQYLSFIKEQTEKGSFAQNSEFNLTIEQFTSYNELKVAFGSNTNTNMLFWGSSSSTEIQENTISKATGLYVKFYQTSFKAIMDYPANSIAALPSALVDSAVYINSVTYGRLGIMTLETNSTAEYSKQVTNKVFSKLFSSGSSTLTNEEKAFLDGCDYKLYFIGGNGKTSVESFTGFEAFVQHIKSGTFSKNEPGAPLFCTFNHVKDNSPVSIRFKFNIKREPLYVELILKEIPKENGTNKTGCGDLYLYFYKNRSKIPTIAPAELAFKLKTTHIRGGNKIDTDTSVVSTIYKNAGYQTSILLKSNIYTHNAGHRCSGPPWDRECESFFERYIYTIENNENYVIMGENPID